MNRTLTIIKPDAFGSGKAGKIMFRIKTAEKFCQFCRYFRLKIEA